MRGIIVYRFSGPLSQGSVLGRVGEISINADGLSRQETLTKDFPLFPVIWTFGTLTIVLIYMSSSASSSDTGNVPSSTPTKISPLSDFDPFAVHPFTRYTSSNPNSNPQLNCDRSNESSCGHEAYSTLHKPQPTTPISLFQKSSPPEPYAPRIFVPFRQEASSPDLSDVLKPKSEKHITKGSKTHPKPDTAAYIPAAPIGHPNSQKHR